MWALTSQSEEATWTWEKHSDRIDQEWVSSFPLLRFELRVFFCFFYQPSSQFKPRHAADRLTPFDYRRNPVFRVLKSFGETTNATAFCVGFRVQLAPSFSCACDHYQTGVRNGIWGSARYAPFPFHLPLPLDSHLPFPSIVAFPIATLYGSKNRKPKNKKPIGSLVISRTVMGSSVPVASICLACLYPLGRNDAASIIRPVIHRG
ncbi:hypothetical protein B0F90DRAFT_290078 [Multifurca ochricompacta]|uniref:Uncharacterized protein n=1 Tax=Multifurca ochricompacta TaxID=376703 RepID=A0AAD4M552_9AGAM|nr:hypothetical protein B0F90DRAFT_290078 [Multifurca ochricompacta]